MAVITNFKGTCTLNECVSWFQTNLTPQMHSLMSHKAQHSTKERKSSENNSSQRLLTDGTNMVKSSDTTALSHVHSLNAGSSGSNPQVQGIKPSGLRMPLPSLRFFCEVRHEISKMHYHSRCLKWIFLFSRLLRF